MIKLGIECVLFRGEAGSIATTEVKEITTVNVTLSKSQVDITTRGGDGWKIFRGGLKDATIEANVNYDTEDEAFKAFQKSFFKDEPMALFISDGEGNGFDADFEVFDFSQPQEMDDAVKCSVTLKPTRSGNNARAPKWIDDGSGTKPEESSAE